MDVRPDAPLSPFHEGHYWFDCKTHRLPYDPVVMMAMIALKNHLGDSVVMRSKGRWEREWGVYCLRPDGSKWEGRDHPSATEVYEHVFPGQAGCSFSRVGLPRSLREEVEHIPRS